MGFVNKIMLMGNLTRDPELRQLPSGTAVCDFGLATNRVYKTAGGEEKQETVFVDCTAFGRTAEVIAEYCPKGRSIFVEGRLHFEAWEDKQGNRRSRLSVIVEQFQFVGARESDGAAPDDDGTRAADRAQERGAGRQKSLPMDAAPRGTTTEIKSDEPRSGGGKERAGKTAHATARTGGKSRGEHRGNTATHAASRTADNGSEEMEDVDLPF